jgi:hypothetical protein
MHTTLQRRESNVRSRNERKWSIMSVWHLFAGRPESCVHVAAGGNDQTVVCAGPGSLNLRARMRGAQGRDQIHAFSILLFPARQPQRCSCTNAKKERREHCGGILPNKSLPKARPRGKPRRERTPCASRPAPMHALTYGHTRLNGQRTGSTGAPHQPAWKIFGKILCQVFVMQFS